MANDAPLLVLNGNGDVTLALGLEADRDPITGPRHGGLPGELKDLLTIDLELIIVGGEERSAS
jgi:hypothetical protein